MVIGRTGRSGWLSPPALAIILVVAAILVGGGGSPAPFAELALQAFAASVLVVGLFAHTWVARKVDPVVWLLAMIVVALPALQLVPLPPGVWQALPGRESEVAALSLVGAQDDWMPWSMVPSATLASFLSLGPSLLMLYAVAVLSQDERARLFQPIAWCGIAAAMLGLFQVTSGNESFYIYKASSVGWLTGFQAGRNLAADVLVIAMLAWAACQPIALFSGASRLVGAGGIAFLALAVVLTGSRTGIAIMVVMLPLAFYLAGTFRNIPPRRVFLAIVAGLVAIGLAAAFLFASPALRRTLERLTSADTLRFDIWTDAWAAATAYWPAGGGMGAFIPLFMPFERLEVLDGMRTNRAHNDYLELLIEGGATAMALLAIAIGLLAWLAVRSLRRADADRRQTMFALGTIAVVAAHSLVDYPLRSMSIACLFATAVALLCPPSLPEFRKGRSR